MQGEVAEKDLPLAGYQGLVRTNNLGPVGMWILCAILGLIALASFAQWLKHSDGQDLYQAVGFSLFALFCARGAVVGLLVSDSGIKARTLFRTFNWHWNEVKNFSLRGTVYTPSLQVELRDGTSRGIVGLAARTKSEQAKADQLLEELRSRLAIEHSRSSFE